MTNSVIPYSDEQLKAHVLGEFMPIAQTCLVCDSDLHVTWTGRNGEARCLTCGMAYDIAGCRLSKETLERFNLKPADIVQVYTCEIQLVPLYRVYWEQFHRRLPLGMYISDRGIYTPEEYKSFYSWLAQQAELYRSALEAFYDWDALVEWFQNIS